MQKEYCTILSLRLLFIELLERFTVTWNRNLSIRTFSLPGWFNLCLQFLFLRNLLLAYLIKSIRDPAPGNFSSVIVLPAAVKASNAIKGNKILTPVSSLLRSVYAESVRWSSQGEMRTVPITSPFLKRKTMRSSLCIKRVIVDTNSRIPSTIAVQNRVTYCKINTFNSVPLIGKFWFQKFWFFQNFAGLWETLTKVSGNF